MQGADSQVEISVNGTRIDKPIVPAASSVSLDAGGVPIPSPEIITYIVPPGHKNVQYLFARRSPFNDIKNLLIKGFKRVSFRTSSLVTNPQALMYPPLVLGQFFDITRTERMGGGEKRATVWKRLVDQIRISVPERNRDLQPAVRGPAPVQPACSSNVSGIGNRRHEHK